MKPLSERLKDFTASQFIDWLCLACVDVREVRTPIDAQEEINKIREAVTERLLTLEDKLRIKQNHIKLRDTYIEELEQRAEATEACTNSLTNAQEALKSAGIEADTVQAGVMELKAKLDALAESFDDLAKAVGWSVAQCEQTGESPMDAAVSLVNLVSELEKDAYPTTDEWAIDNTCGRPILVYKGCSVIEAGDAAYILNLVKKDKLRSGEKL